MAFQFLCPEGHLLQGEASEAGQQCTCPYCGMLFVVPAPPQAAPAGPSAAQAVDGPPTLRPPDSQPAADQPPPFLGSFAQQQPVSEAPAESGGQGFPGIQTDPEFGQAGPPAAGPESFEVQSAAEMGLVYIPCPSGHELETPREMLGQDAMCPYCQVQFHLRLEDSVEYRNEKAEQQAHKEFMVGQMWMRWSIATAVVVVVGVILLVILSLAD